MCHDLVRGKVQKVGNKPKIGGVHLHVSAIVVWSQSFLTVDFFSTKAQQIVLFQEFYQML